MMKDVILDPKADEIPHPGLRELYRYWCDRRASPDLPGRGDIDPLDIPALLPNLMLIDVADNPPAMTYRLVGTALVTRMGRDATGLPLQEGDLGWDGAKVLCDYLYVIGEARPCLRIQRSPDRAGRPGACQRLLLPLARDGRQVDMLLGAAFWADESP
jgi:hypothetical protein